MGNLPFLANHFMISTAAAAAATANGLYKLCP